jgi:hypothetical protein
VAETRANEPSLNEGEELHLKRPPLFQRVRLQVLDKMGGYSTLFWDQAFI